jgi:hypothetical protein
LVKIGTRYVSKKKGWKEDRKAKAAVCNFRALMKAGGPKKFFKRVAALPTEQERIQFLSNGETFQYYWKKGARDTLIELGLAKECMALDARILGLLEKVGVKLKRGSLDREYERIEEELIEKVAKPLNISGARLDRVLFQYNKQVVGGIWGRIGDQECYTLHRTSEIYDWIPPFDSDKTVFSLWYYLALGTLAFLQNCQN